MAICQKLTTKASGHLPFDQSAAFNDHIARALVNSMTNDEKNNLTYG